MVKVHYDVETKKVKGFYPDFIEYPQIPEPYVEISDDMHKELCSELNQGQELFITNIEAKEFGFRDFEKDPIQEKQNRIAELKGKLNSTDYQAIKYAEGQLSESEYEGMKTQRQLWRDEINQIEEELGIQKSV